MNARLTATLADSDPSTRLWAAYALSRRLPLDDATLTQLASYLDDPLPDLRARVRWSFLAAGPLSDTVRQAVQTHDPTLADELLRRKASASHS